MKTPSTQGVFSMKALTRSTLTACLASLAVVAGSAWAQQSTGSTGTAGTGAATGAAAKATGAGDNKSAIAAAFKRADANGDGKMSKEESARLPEVQAKFDELDKDKDGSLSLAEFTAAFEMPKQ
jgi:Ca2+-binding EF-hand superfamily protein